MTKYKMSVREDLCTETVTRTHWNCQEQGGTGLFHSSLCQMKFVDQSLLQGITPAVAAIARGMYLESILSCILQQSIRNHACHPLLCALLQASSGSPLGHVLHHVSMISFPTQSVGRRRSSWITCTSRGSAFFSGLMTLKQETPNAGSVPTFSSKPRSRPNETESFQYMFSGEA